jgi:hypothetical protein
MNGKTAKAIGKLALTIVNMEGISGGEGKGRYQQEMNCIVWEPAYTDGHRHDFDDPDNNLGHERMCDPDGNKLLGQFRNPGTIRTKWTYRIVYQNLKRLWKRTHGTHYYFTRRFLNELRTSPIPRAD